MGWLIALALIAGFVALCVVLVVAEGPERRRKRETMCANGEHEWWNPTLGMNEKPTRCYICGVLHPDEQS